MTMTSSSDRWRLKMRLFAFLHYLLFPMMTNETLGLNPQWSNQIKSNLRSFLSPSHFDTRWLKSPLPSPPKGQKPKSLCIFPPREITLVTREIQCYWYHPLDLYPYLSLLLDISVSKILDSLNSPTLATIHHTRQRFLAYNTPPSTQRST